jgi:hypothetical protein
MSRYYTQLECGCLVSCDGSGGLISSCKDGDLKCKVHEYFEEHEMLRAICIKCQPEEYKKELQELRNHCLNCYSSNMLNYFIKKDGEYTFPKEYWRCNECSEIIELTINFDGEVVAYK